MVSEERDVTVIELWFLFVSKSYSFNSCLDNDEVNFEFCYIKNNNETKPGCIFDENLVNFDRPDDIEEIIDNSQTVKRTETLSYKPLPSLCNELYSVMKKNN